MQMGLDIKPELNCIEMYIGCGLFIQYKIKEISLYDSGIYDSFRSSCADFIVYVEIL